MGVCAFLGGTMAEEQMKKMDYFWMCTSSCCLTVVYSIENGVDLYYCVGGVDPRHLLVPERSALVLLLGVTS